MEDRISSTAAMHLARRQRHSFLNHLQVISGWMQLGQPERARKYLEEAAGRMAAESHALKQVGASLGLVMVELGLEAETHGVDLHWQVEEQADALTDTERESLREAVLAAVKDCSLQAGDDRRLLVRLTGGAFSVHTPAPGSEG